jgi:hypothetical protein
MVVGEKKKYLWGSSQDRLAGPVTMALALYGHQPIVCTALTPPPDAQMWRSALQERFGPRHHWRTMLFNVHMLWNVAHGLDAVSRRPPPTAPRSMYPRPFKAPCRSFLHATGSTGFLNVPARHCSSLATKARFEGTHLATAWVSWAKIDSDVAPSADHDKYLILLVTTPFCVGHNNAIPFSLRPILS